MIHARKIYVLNTCYDVKKNYDWEINFNQVIFVKSKIQQFNL